MIYITTIAFNNPLFISLQIKSFNLYITDKNYKFLVFDDSLDNKHTINIKNICIENNIEYIRITQDIHKNRNLVFKNELTETRKIMIKNNPNIDLYNNIELNNTVGSRHADSVQFIFNYFIKNITDCTILFNIDSDMFIINELNIENLIGNNEIIYAGHGFPTHIWPNVFIFNFEKCKNLHEICWDGCITYNLNGDSYSNDVGGETHEYLTKYYNHENTKSIESTHLTSYEEIFNIKNYIDEETYSLLNEIYELYDKKYLNKEILLKYNEKFTIFHLRGYTWTDIYINIGNKLDKLLINRFSKIIN
jgi:hypothetical protein